MQTAATGAWEGEHQRGVYGEPWLARGSLATDFQYTGQRSFESTLGSLQHYKARWYSPILGQFLQPDTIVPGAANPQNLNRYAYVRGNPLRLTDPTGHGGTNQTDSDPNHTDDNDNENGGGLGGTGTGSAGPGSAGSGASSSVSRLPRFPGAPQHPLANHRRQQVCLRVRGTCCREILKPPAPREVDTIIFRNLAIVLRRSRTSVPRILSPVNSEPLCKGNLV
jgi:RHS repeat-associated protein